MDQGGTEVHGTTFTEIMEFDELLVRQLMDKVAVCDERSEEGLKSGVLISIQR